MRMRRLLKFLPKIEFSPHLRKRNPFFVANLAPKKKYAAHAAASKRTSSQKSEHGFTRALNQCLG
jgi:hypothetical protein